MNDLTSKRITFPDKQSNSNIGNDDLYHLTAGNINNIKNSLNVAIDNIIELKNRLDQNIESRIISLNETVKNLDVNPSFKVLLDQADISLSGQIKNIYTELSKFDSIIKDNIVDKLPQLETNCYNNKKEIQKLQIKFDELNQTPDDLEETKQKLVSAFLKINDIEVQIDKNNKNFKKLQDDQSINTNLIKTNTSELTSLKNLVNNLRDDLINENKQGNKTLNKFLTMITNILYYIDQVEERLYTQDARDDHLERLIRGLEEPDNWDDWNLLFRLLNELKLKIGRLSLINKVPVDEVIITDENINEFKYLLNEIQNKLKKLPHDEIVETDIDVQKINEIISNIDLIRKIDVLALNFYPVYP